MLQRERAASSEPPMRKKTKHPTNDQPKTTPTFLLELPLQVNNQQAKHLRGHFEAARQLYNALLGEAVKRLRHMRAESRWQQARLIPRSDKQARKAAFAARRLEHGFSEYALPMPLQPRRIPPGENASWSHSK